MTLASLHAIRAAQRDAAPQSHFAPRHLAPLNKVAQVAQWRSANLARAAACSTQAAPARPPLSLRATDAALRNHRHQDHRK
jgi:hypothetical protein